MFVRTLLCECVLILCRFADKDGLDLLSASPRIHARSLTSGTLSASKGLFLLRDRAILAIGFEIFLCINLFVVTPFLYSLIALLPRIQSNNVFLYRLLTLRRG